MLSLGPSENETINETAGNSSTVADMDSYVITSPYDKETSFGENKEFISRIADWIRVMLAGLNGG
jgi:hypothetical protein